MRGIAKSITLGACAAAVLSLTAVTGASANPAVCGDTPWHVGDGAIVRLPLGGTVRSGPSTGCTAVGVIGSGNVVRLDCYVANAAGTWSHISSTTTGLKGWLRDVQGNPAADVPC